MQLNDLPLKIQLTLIIEHIAFAYKIPPHELINRYSLPALLTLSEIAEYRRNLEEIALESEESAVPKFIRHRADMLSSLYKRYSKNNQSNSGGSQ